MKKARRVLARSDDYTVSHEYEVVLLHRPRGSEVVIGDFHGDPEAAIIDFHQKWVIVVGCGMILYWLRKPFTPYEYDRTTDQWWEIHRSPPDEWWIESVYQVTDNVVRFVVDLTSRVAGVYELDVESLSISKVIPNEEGV